MTDEPTRLSCVVFLHNAEYTPKIVRVRAPTAKLLDAIAMVKSVEALQIEDGEGIDFQCANITEFGIVCRYILPTLPDSLFLFTLSLNGVFYNAHTLRMQNPDGLQEEYLQDYSKEPYTVDL